MSYLSALDKIRSELDSEPTAFVLPSTFNGGKGVQVAAPKRDPLELSKQWIGTIRSSGMRAKERQDSQVEMASASRRLKPTLAESLAAGAKREEPVEKEETEVRRPELLTKEQAARRSMFAGQDALTGSGGVVDGPAGSFVEIMDQTEGGGRYDTLFGHSQKSGPFAGVDITKMTLGQLKEFASPKGEYGNWVKSQVGRVATPMGRYQFTGTTLRQVSAEMGLPDDTLFDKNTQDALFKYHLNKTLARGSTLQEKVSLLRGQWEGFKSVPTAKLVSLIRGVA